MEKIAFIGIKDKGKWMVRRLMRAGFEVNIFVREKDTVNDLLVSGAVYKSTISKCIEGCSKVVTFSDFPKEQEEDYFGENNIVDSVTKDIYIVSIDTDKTISERLDKEVMEKDLHMVKGVSYGDEDNAKFGTTIFEITGDKDDIDVCRPVFEAMGSIKQ